MIIAAYESSENRGNDSRHEIEIYKSPNLHVFGNLSHCLPVSGTRRSVFVSFPMRDECGSAFGKVVFDKNDIDVIYVTCADGSWFQYPDSLEASQAIREATSGYDDIITYGTSMGGYGALMLSGPIGATTILSCSPQYSIDPVKVPFEPRYRNDVPRVMNHGGFTKDDLEATLSRDAKIIMLYDPRDLFDKQHARLVQRHRDVNTLLVPFSGHKSLGALREMGLASHLIRLAAAGRLDPLAFRRAIRGKRNSSAIYLRFLARALHARGMRGVNVVLARVAELSDRDWDGLRTDVRLLSEHGSEALAAKQFLKLILLDRYLRSSFVVADLMRWTPFLIRAGAHEMAKEHLASVVMSGRIPQASHARIALAKLAADMGESHNARLHIDHMQNDQVLLYYCVEVFRILQQIGDVQGGLKILQTAHAADPENLAILNALSDNLYRLNRTEDALTVLELSAKYVCLPIRPLRHRLARLLESTGRLEQAIALYNSILDENPSDGLALRVKGACLHRLGKHQAAIEAYQMCLQDPEQGQHAARGLAQVHKALQLL